jgi:hypothetical protein
MRGVRARAAREAHGFERFADQVADGHCVD